MLTLFRKLLKSASKRPSADHANREPDSVPKVREERTLGAYERDKKALEDTFTGCSDIQLREVPPGLVGRSAAFVVYFESLTRYETVEHALRGAHSLTELPEDLRPNEVTGDADIMPLQQLEDAVRKVLEGWTVILIRSTNAAYAVNTFIPPMRNIERSETESVILGSQEAFNESIQINLGLIRKRLKTPSLKVSVLPIGKYTRSIVTLLHLEGIAQSEYVHSLQERLKHVEIDGLSDAGELSQLIDDNPFSPFPQFHLTDRPDRIVSHLLDGKVALLMDGSPFALSGPASFIEFFQSSEDYANRWVSASVIRTLRIVGVLISISLSALYVSVVTYHYQMIPSDMLVTLAESRSRVPFPPVYETLMMELTIELLREAGARLPTKTGQTIGIVGGIVIGQAAVQAGLTSNILIIAVALSTIASFITPSYIMSTAMRAIRFPLILCAGWWGLYGLFIGLLMIVVHFLRLSSLGAPYFAPLAPFRLTDWKDTLLRAPTPFMNMRPTNTRPREAQRIPYEDETTPAATPTSQSIDPDKEERP